MNVNIAEQTAPAEFNYQLDNIIVPRWRVGEDALAPVNFTIDAAQLDSQALALAMRAVYEQFGIVRVTGRNDNELSGMQSLAENVLGGVMQYEAGANPRDAIQDNVFEVGAPLTAWLHYHHEMAYVAESPKALAFLCRHAFVGGGETYFADNIAATNEILATDFGQKLKAKGVCYHRRLTNRERFVDQIPLGVYNHWQQSLGTTNRDEAKRLAEAKGLVVEWEGDELCTRFYSDAYEYFPALDQNVLFSSIADHGMWFDGWPLVMHLPYEQRPLHMTFGDGSEFSQDDLQTFVDVYDNAGIKVEWAPGDVVVFCNYRFAHGRPGIQLQAGARRELGVMLGETLHRRGQVDTAW